MRIRNQVLSVILIFLVSVCFHGALFAGETINYEIYKPLHRDAVALAESIGPLVKHSVNLSSFQGKIIIKGSKANIATVKQMLGELDIEARIFVIETKAMRQVDEESSGFGVSGNFNIGGIGASAGKKNANANATGNVTYRDRHGSVTADVSQATTTSASGGVQTVVVQEGRQAMLSDVGGASGTTVLVTPFLRGKQVELALNKQTTNDQTGKFSQVKTKLYVPLNAWYNIGGTGIETSAQTNRVLSSQDQKSRSNSDFLVRVKLK